MAQRYSDLVRLRESKPAYNIQNEEHGEWSSFIPNDQFNGIVRKVVSSVFNTDADTHKSFWIEGTYGTGKSHAAAVIKHLLCDDVEDIEDWVNEEYAAQKYDQLRNSIYKLREKKRLFPVMMYGQNGISHIDDLSLQIQKAVKDVLSKAQIDLLVKTDFDNYVQHIEDNPDIWEVILSRSPKLRSITPDLKKLISDLKMYDTNTLAKAEEALRESGINVRLDSANLQNWLFEVQNKLRELNIADGLLIVWDEFTTVMTSDIGLALLTPLQDLTEAAMNSANDSYFFFISHPSALNSLKVEERDKTKGRYHYMKYNMEPVSAFKIMSRKFKLVDGQGSAYNAISANFFATNSELIDRYSQSSTNPDDTRADIKNLFPLHPATANLATYYAREAGSSSRSVFEFLGDNEAIREFLDSEEEYLNRNTITADYLWDYVLEEFNSNITKFGIVTERYNSSRLHVDNKGAQYTKVFKGILLLNALNNIANNDSVTPSEDNIKSLFRGTQIEYELDDILKWINEESVVQRDPSGSYLIRFTALPPQETAQIQEKLLNDDFKFTSRVINFGDTARTMFDKSFKGIMRPMKFEFYGVDTNNYTLQSKIENGRKNAKSYELFIAILVAKNSNELSEMKSFAEQTAQDDRFQDVIFLIFDAEFGDQNYSRFIEYMANAKVAQQHGFADQNKSYTENAQAMIKDWVKEMQRSVVTIYIRETKEVVSCNKLMQTLNFTIAPMIFSHGPESLEEIKLRSSQTYWKKALVRDTVKTVLSFNTKTEITDKSKGPAMHVVYLLQDSVDENLEWKHDVDPQHPLKLICDFVDTKIKNAVKQVNFNLAEKFIELSRPPYGLFQTYSCMAMLAFAMRKYANKIFDLQGKPRSAQHLVDDVLEVFKSWESGTISQKCTLKFETPEEGILCKKFISVFKLREFKEYSDISSLKDARWAISHEFVKSKGFPLWSLKYIDDSDSIPSDERSTLIDNIIKICSAVGTSNPSMNATTIKLIKKWDFEFKKLINSQDNYRRGFSNFLQRDEIVNLQDEEIETAVDYIVHHIQVEVGTWTEDEVINALKNWRISTRPTVPTPTPNSPATPPVTPSGGIPQPPMPPIIIPASLSKIEEAKEAIEQMNEADLYAILNEIADLGYDDILDIILSN